MLVFPSKLHTILFLFVCSTFSHAAQKDVQSMKVFLQRDRHNLENTMLLNFHFYPENQKKFTWAQLFEKHVKSGRPVVIQSVKIIGRPGFFNFHYNNPRVNNDPNLVATYTIEFRDRNPFVSEIKWNEQNLQLSHSTPPVRPGFAVPQYPYEIPSAGPYGHPLSASLSVPAQRPPMPPAYPPYGQPPVEFARPYRPGHPLSASSPMPTFYQTPHMSPAFPVMPTYYPALPYGIPHTYPHSAEYPLSASFTTPTLYTDLGILIQQIGHDAARRHIQSLISNTSLHQKDTLRLLDDLKYLLSPSPSMPPVPVESEPSTVDSLAEPTAAPVAQETSTANPINPPTIIVSAAASPSVPLSPVLPTSIPSPVTAETQDTSPSTVIPLAESTPAPVAPAVSIEQPTNPPIPSPVMASTQEQVAASPATAPFVTTVSVVPKSSPVDPVNHPAIIASPAASPSTPTFSALPVATPSSVMTEMQEQDTPLATPTPSFSPVAPAVSTVDLGLANFPALPAPTTSSSKQKKPVISNTPLAKPTPPSSTAAKQSPCLLRTDKPASIVDKRSKKTPAPAPSSLPTPIVPPSKAASLTPASPQTPPVHAEKSTTQPVTTGLTPEAKTSSSRSTSSSQQHPRASKLSHIGSTRKGTHPLTQPSTQPTPPRPDAVVAVKPALPTSPIAVDPTPSAPSVPAASAPTTHPQTENDFFETPGPIGRQKPDTDGSKQERKIAALLRKKERAAKIAATQEEADTVRKIKRFIKEKDYAELEAYLKSKSGPLQRKLALESIKLLSGAQSDYRFEWLSGYVQELLATDTENPSLTDEEKGLCHTFLGKYLPDLQQRNFHLLCAEQYKAGQGAITVIEPVCPPDPTVKVISKEDDARSIVGHLDQVVIEVRREENKSAAPNLQKLQDQINAADFDIQVNSIASASHSDVQVADQVTQNIDDAIKAYEERFTTSTNIIPTLQALSLEDYEQEPAAWIALFNMEFTKKLENICALYIYAQTFILRLNTILQSQHSPDYQAKLKYLQTELSTWDTLLSSKTPGNDLPQYNPFITTIKEAAIKYLKNQQTNVANEATVAQIYDLLKTTPDEKLTSLIFAIFVHGEVLQQDLQKMIDAENQTGIKEKGLKAFVDAYTAIKDFTPLIATAAENYSKAESEEAKKAAIHEIVSLAETKILFANQISPFIEALQIHALSIHKDVMAGILRSERMSYTTKTLFTQEYRKTFSFKK